MYLLQRRQQVRERIRFAAAHPALAFAAAGNQLAQHDVEIGRLQRAAAPTARSASAGIRPRKILAR
jgi:hypothetical protein